MPICWRGIFREKSYSVSDLLNHFDEVKGKRVRVHGKIRKLVPSGIGEKAGRYQWIILGGDDSLNLDCVETIGPVYLKPRISRADPITLEGIVVDRYDLREVSVDRGIVIALQNARVIE